ncbi:hypothetical protein VP01_5378g1 [Puccinia sorghi]|uniref:Uncharacterized protein n=1 Tax=Puccinia sorghi TaxID=27349 RepID=A0A0L6UJY9_9BASI|nr:hypothetical protein VP01_5378g1 [Puccinia sorghi]
MVKPDLQCTSDTCMQLPWTHPCFQLPRETSIEYYTHFSISLQTDTLKLHNSEYSWAAGQDDLVRFRGGQDGWKRKGRGWGLEFWEIMGWSFLFSMEIHGMHTIREGSQQSHSIVGFSGHQGTEKPKKSLSALSLRSALLKPHQGADLLLIMEDARDEGRAGSSGEKLEQMEEQDSSFGAVARKRRKGAPSISPQSHSSTILMQPPCISGWDSTLQCLLTLACASHQPFALQQGGWTHINPFSLILLSTFFSPAISPLIILETIGQQSCQLYFPHVVLLSMWEVLNKWNSVLQKNIKIKNILSCTYTRKKIKELHGGSLTYPHLILSLSTST